MEKYNHVPIEELKKFKEYYDNQVGRKYPCSNQHVVCGIITEDRNKAINFMVDKPVIYKSERIDAITWWLDNGERWLWRKWNDDYRGYRFYKVAIDRLINKDFYYFAQSSCACYCSSVEII